jgi:ribosomal protein L24E
MSTDDIDAKSAGTGQPVSRADRLADRLMEDRAKRASKSAGNIGGCFLCGRSYSVLPPMGDNSTRFCSDKCQEAYDAGAMPARDVNPFAVPADQWRVIAGPLPGYMPKIAMQQGKHGFYINCLHCKREFESKGLRCCSVECERAYQGRVAAAQVVAEVGGTLTEKRKCSICGGPIPKYVGTGKHRRLTNKTKTTCSNRCQEKARKMGLPEASNSVDAGVGPSEPIQPIFGPSTPPLNLVGGYRWPGAPRV